MTQTQKGLLAACIIIVIAAIGTGGYLYRDKIPALPGSGPAISEVAEAHILYGDKKGGGHKFGAGKNCKSEFPKSWDDAEIIDNVKKVAANDNLNWKKQGNGYFVATDKIDGIKVRVVLDKERDDVVTAYPLNTKRNECGIRTSAKVKQPTPAPTASEPEAVEPAAGIANAASRQSRTTNFNKN